MRTFLLIASLVLLSCQYKPGDTITEYGVGSSVDTVAIKLETQTLYQINTTDYFYSTFSITNNLNRDLDSVTVTFTIGNSTVQRYTYAPMAANEVRIKSISHRTTNDVEVSARWW